MRWLWRSRAAELIVSRRFLPVDVRSPGVFNGGTMSSFKSDMNLCLLKDWLSLTFILFAALYVAWCHVSGAVLVYRGILFLGSMCQVILIIQGETYN